MIGEFFEQLFSQVRLAHSRFHVGISLPSGPDA
jgi:hypothetical protein